LLEKTITISKLFDFYGSLLTARQQEIMKYYFYHDLSLSEIAENLDISRQGVHDHLQRAENQLQQYEKKLGLLASYRGLQEQADFLRSRLQDDRPLTEADRQELLQAVEKITGCL